MLSFTPGRMHQPLLLQYDKHMSCIFSPRSTSLVTPTRALSWKRPRPGLPGHPSTSLTMGVTTSSDFGTRAKPVCLIQTCWRWEDRELRCGTALVMEPVAAPPTVSQRLRGDWPASRDRHSVSSPSSQNSWGGEARGDFSCSLWLSHVYNNDLSISELIL